ncbi:MAG: fibronectin type III domain-containing protein, partial [Bacteroidia bacterium]|nr:fibronectin type III domain-containing protein [Bacteroidia bacterium]
MKFFNVLVFVLISGLFRAQSLANYSSTRNTSITYNSIASSGNSFASWRNTTSNTQDDNRSDLTNIGFDFWYNGVRYTQFCVSTNGFLDFSNSTDDGGPQADDFGYNNTAFTAANAANATRPAIAPFYDDLTAQGGTAALGNSLKYLLTGTAPNRTLTVEWINMAVYQNTSPSLNFQVQLVESTGVIIINYGTMTAGTNVFSYSMGMNGPTVSNTPTSAQLKMLQTANSNSFSNTIQNNLSTMPASNSQYVFTPLVPTTASGGLTFSGVTQTGMTLNWTNWASNEVGYVVYNSTDNINFDFVVQSAANATTTAITGLLPSTTYYWKLYAVTEGYLSAAINGTQATLAAGNKTSTATGNWNTAATWSPSGVPTSADNVYIANGHTVSINANAVCNNLTVGQGTSGYLQFTGTARTMTVNNNITVNSNATFLVSTGSNVTHSITVEGNIVNNGTVNFASDANSLVNVSFVRDGNQTLSGSGATNTYNNISMTLGAADHILEISSSSFSAASNFLTLNSGLLKISTTNAVNITPFSAAATISANSGLWLNSSNLTVNTGAGITLYGGITISNGTLNVGNAANEDILSNGGSIVINNGAMNIAGKLDASSINNTLDFNINGGSLTVPSVGSTNTSIAPFHIAGAGSQWNMTGGAIIIPRSGGTGSQNLG